MAGPNPSTIKTYLSGAAVGANKLVKLSADETVIEAVDGAAPILGVSTYAVTGAAERIEVVVQGLATVKAGGTIARTDYITASTAGVAVASAPGAGVNSNVAGISAGKAAASGDLVDILLAPGRIQG